jgi:hypothetical protein
MMYCSLLHYPLLGEVDTIVRLTERLNVMPVYEIFMKSLKFAQIISVKL